MKDHTDQKINHYIPKIFCSGLLIETNACICLDPNNSEVGLGNVFVDAFDEVKKGLNNAQKGAEKLIMGTPAPTPVEATRLF